MGYTVRCRDGLHSSYNPIILLFRLCLVEPLHNQFGDGFLQVVVSTVLHLDDDRIVETDHVVP